jgi:GTPase
VFRVKDNGTLDGLNEQDLEFSLQVVQELVMRANLSQELTEIVPLEGGQKFICQVKIELKEDRAAQTREGKVVFLGAAGSGKTTLLSVLSDWSCLDDGRGKMRTRLLHHRHELLTGTTSSITHQPLVFLPSSRQPLALADPELLLQLERRREILSEGRVVQLVDSAGKLRFDWTVYSVLTASSQPPDWAFLVIDPNETSDTSLSETFSLFRLLKMLKIKVAWLINKIDQSSTEIISRLLEKLSAGIGGKSALKLYNEGVQVDECEIPVLLVSTVTGQFLPLLASFLFQLANEQASRHHPQQANPFIYAMESAKSGLIIEQAISLAQVGPVVYGQVAFGSISVGDEMVLGPQHQNQPLRLKITSIQRLKCPITRALQGQHVSLAIQPISGQNHYTIDKGMILLSSTTTTTTGNFSLKPLKRIIGDLTQLSTKSCKSRFKGVLFVMGRRFAATLDIQPRTLNHHEQSRKFVCLISFELPAAVFLFPGAPIIFIENGRKEKFAGEVLDYFA